jgi:hypothetical protein
MGCAVGRVRRLVLEVEKKELLPEPSVLHAHAARHVGIVRDDATSPQFVEPGVVHGEKGTE